MPSWNVHTAHAECLLAGASPSELGIEDANAFLFGSYVPDIYVGFMVPDATYHVDYCLTHLAAVTSIPVPNADLFWDAYVARRRPHTPAGLSLTLGAWAHLVADRDYNSRFREFCALHSLPIDEALRIRKQSDFDVFGCSLDIVSCVELTDELVDAARAFRGYSILAEDVRRAADVANAIVRSNSASRNDEEYRLLSAEWMSDVFECCNERILMWLAAWRRLVARGASVSAADVREELERR